MMCLRTGTSRDGPGVSFSVGIPRVVFFHNCSLFVLKAISFSISRSTSLRSFLKNKTQFTQEAPCLRCGLFKA